jgi:hypothetical protein
MCTQLTSKPSLIADDPRQPGSGGVGVYRLDPEVMGSLSRYLRAGGALQSLLNVAVVPTGAATGGGLPPVHGRYQVLDDGVRFVPHFPFERGRSYRASFDARPLGGPELSPVLTLEFSHSTERGALPAQVTDIFPSSDELPENLLRFYISFSNAMRRGRAAAEISILGPDGEPAHDVLYRAPVELWDRDMRYLTVLLDPGRLKRGVGPNRELGPPLKAGQEYTLVVGSGMTDISGTPLSQSVHKRFRVTEAVREPIAIEQWTITRPGVHGHRPLVLNFPRALDRALLSQAINIVSSDGRMIEGRMAIDQGERRLSFTPASAWAAGSYELRVAPSLEDVCGNTVMAAFDRPLRPGSDMVCDVASRSIPFCLA